MLIGFPKLENTKGRFWKEDDAFFLSEDQSELLEQFRMN
jgi:hypothetical protein